MGSSAEVSEAHACLVLVDYDNAFPPNARLSDEEISREVEGWLQRLSLHFPNVTTFEVRLYGGWYDEQDLSRHGSEVARILPLLPEFPMSIRDDQILRGSISLAGAPLAQGIGTPLLGTYRHRGSLPRVRLTKEPYPDECAQDDAHCPAAILRSFTKHSNRGCPVATCSLVASDAFVVHEQKMVDTMLATDVLTAGRMEDRYSVAVVVSGDSDFVPPLLAARVASGIHLVQLRPRAKESSEYAAAVLTDAGIEVM